jgi:hypothetical protein
VRRVLGARRLVLLALVLGALMVAAFVAFNSKPDYGHGVTNAKIDSTVKFEFDYHADRTCPYEDVMYVFYDGNGNKLGSFIDTTMNAVVAGRNYHYVITAALPSMALDPRAVRFQANASCNGTGLVLRQPGQGQRTFGE